MVGRAHGRSPGPRDVEPVVSSEFAQPVAAWRGSTDPAAPLVVLLHGRGSNEDDIVELAAHLPAGPAYVALRAPLGEGGGFAWFANRGIGRPLAASLAETMAWFVDWLDDVAPASRSVVLVGFSGGAAFAGGLILSRAERFAGAAILLGTLPFDAGVGTEDNQLAGRAVLVAQGDADVVIPRELLEQTWDYLTTRSGADVTTHRDPGGHGLSVATVAVLNAWIADVLAIPGRGN